MSNDLYWKLPVTAVLSVLAGAIFGHFLPYLFRLADTHEGVAAWVQATGAIIAIVATAMIARSASLREQQQKAEERESMAAAIAIRLSAVTAQLEQACTSAVKYLNAHPFGESIPHESVNALRVGMEMPQDVLPMLHVMTPAEITAIGGMYARVARYNSLIEATAFRLINLNAFETITFDTQARLLLQSITAMASQTDDAIAFRLGNGV